MLGISIDLGTYSIKILTYSMERKSIKIRSSHEIVIDSEYIDISDTSSLWAYQLSEIKKYLNSIDSEYVIFSNLPTDIVSTRFLTLPVKNKKKASQMLPFQIEEDLPYSLSDCHYSESILIEDNAALAQVGLVKKEDFTDFFKHMRVNDIAPKVLSCDTSSLSVFVRENIEFLPEQFSIIDFGHTSTKAYYFSQGEMVSAHTSYIAGKSITDAIAKTYNISNSEATLYKHKNSFLLLEDQYEQVNDNQKEFAKLMDTTLSPLLNEMKRWDIGHRVKHGTAVSDTYIIGGSSKIKSLDSYIAGKLDIKVSNVNFTQPYEGEDARSNFFATVLGQISHKKPSLINFLRGEYSIQSSSELPIDMFSFLFVRAAIVTAVICCSLLIENFFIGSQIKSADKTLKLILKNQILELSGRDRRTVAKTPQNVLNKLARKEKSIKQIVKTIQSSTQPNAFKSLNQIVAAILGKKVEIIEFNSRSEGDFIAIFKSTNQKELQELDQILRRNKDLKWKSSYSSSSKILTISGQEVSQ